MQYSYSELRQNLKKTIEEINETHQPAVITSHHKPTAVLMSYEDYQSLEETAYLLRSPANARHLLQAILDVEQNKNIVEHPLIKPKSK